MLILLEDARPPGIIMSLYREKVVVRTDETSTATSKERPTK